MKKMMNFGWSLVMAWNVLLVFSIAFLDQEWQMFHWQISLVISGLLFRELMVFIRLLLVLVLGILGLLIDNYLFVQVALMGAALIGYLNGLSVIRWPVRKGRVGSLKILEIFFCFMCLISFGEHIWLAIIVILIAKFFADNEGSRKQPSFLQWFLFLFPITACGALFLILAADYVSPEPLRYSYFKTLIFLAGIAQLVSLPLIAGILYRDIREYFIKRLKPELA